MAPLLAVVLAAVVAYCLARSLLPSLQDPVTMVATSTSGTSS